MSGSGRVQYWEKFWEYMTDVLAAAYKDGWTHVPQSMVVAAWDSERGWGVLSAPGKADQTCLRHHLRPRCTTHLVVGEPVSVRMTLDADRQPVLSSVAREATWASCLDQRKCLCDE